MSYMRVKQRKINENVYLQNRSAVFLTPPMRTGDLLVERNESIKVDLTVGGNLTVGNSLHATNFYASGNFFLNNYVLIPAGTIIQSAAIAQPDGWFDCNGRSLSIYDYAGLFAAIQYAYGGASPSFNIPDMRGRVGVGNLGSYALGTAGGESVHTLTVGEIPAHTHSLTRRSNPDNGAFDTDNSHSAESSAATTDRADLGLFNTSSVGSTQSHNNMQPYVVLRYLIKY